MPWVDKRIGSHGRIRYAAINRDPAGPQRSAAFTSRTAASHEAHATGVAINHASWFEPKNRLGLGGLDELSVRI
jgi:hypothetical protein